MSAVRSETCLKPVRETLAKQTEHNICCRHRPYVFNCWIFFTFSRLLSIEIPTNRFVITFRSHTRLNTILDHRKTSLLSKYLHFNFSLFYCLCWTFLMDKKLFAKKYYQRMSGKRVVRQFRVEIKKTLNWMKVFVVDMKLIKRFLDFSLNFLLATHFQQIRANERAMTQILFYLNGCWL